MSFKGFSATPTATRVSLYRVYPYGQVTADSTVDRAQDGTFAFSNLAAWGHYYLQAESLFGPSGTAGHAVLSTAGPFGVPSAAGQGPVGPVALQVRPVFLEALQQKPAGGSTVLAWASAHVYDPTSAATITDATVTFSNGTKQWAMPYGKNIAGSQSYFATIEPGVPGGTSFVITTQGGALGPSVKTWALAGEPATFDGVVLSPSPGASVPANTALAVTWIAQPLASYTLLELFRLQGTQTTSAYISPAARAPDGTSETVPASALAAPGMYLLNLAYSTASCPVAADGCVYNNSTVPVPFTAQ